MSNDLTEVELDAGLPEETEGYLTFQSDEEKSTQTEEEPGGEDTNLEDEEEEGGEEESEEEEEESGGDREKSEEEIDLFGDMEVPEELASTRDQLVSNYTRKLQEVSKIRAKAQLVDAIDNNPEETIMALAEKYGVEIGGEPEEKSLDIGEIPEPNEKESMSAYMKRVLTAIIPNIAQASQPKTKRKAMGVLDKLSAVENKVKEQMDYLSKNYHDWKLYEDDIAQLVMKNPNLVDDLDSLYEVAKARAQKAMRTAAAKKGNKLSKKAKKTVRTGERATRPAVTTSKGKKLTFNQAWDQAKRDASKLK